MGKYISRETLDNIVIDLLASTRYINGEYYVFGSSSFRKIANQGKFISALESFGSIEKGKTSNLKGKVELPKKKGLSVYFKVNKQKLETFQEILPYVNVQLDPFVIIDKETGEVRYHIKNKQIDLEEIAKFYKLF